MTHDTTSTSERFARIRYWKEFRISAQHLFPTDDALRWFIRKHESALVRTEALLKLPRGNYLDPEIFRLVAIDLMRGAATEPQSAALGCGG
jgi:hypothetical protein